MSRQVQKREKKANIPADDPLFEMMDIFEKGDMENNPLMKKTSKLTIYDLLREHPIAIEETMTPQDWIKMHSIRFKG